MASKAFKKSDARNFAPPETKYFVIGAIGCLFAGGVFPAWGIVFGEMIGLLFNPALPCVDGMIPNLEGEMVKSYPTCDEYYSSVKNDIQELSFEVAAYWAGIIAMCFVGDLLAS